MENTNYSPIKRFEEQLKSEVKQEDINEVTETIEIKEEPIESKDWQETEDPLKIPSASDILEHKFKVEAIDVPGLESRDHRHDGQQHWLDGASLLLLMNFFKIIVLPIGQSLERKSMDLYSGRGSISAQTILKNNFAMIHLNGSTGHT